MLTESVAIVPGFTSYFAFSRLRSGYSGVATFCRSSATPAQSDSSLAQATSIMTGVSDLSEEFSSDELRGLDSEGRCVITRHSVLTSSGDTRHLVIINVYCPRADPERAERGKYQQQFYKALDIRANRLREAGDCVIICGDINTSHKEVDHCDPYEEFSDKPGRRFLTHFLRDLASEATLAEAADDDNQDDWVSTSVRLEERQFVDTFRIFHPDRKHAFTCWSTKGNCRSTNYGTRIDYVFASVNMTDVLADCDIQPDVLGSDHCPVLATFKLRSQPAARPPDNCTKYFKEFSGKQVKTNSTKQLLLPRNLRLRLRARSQVSLSPKTRSPRLRRVLSTRPVLLKFNQRRVLKSLATTTPRQPGGQYSILFHQHLTVPSTRSRRLRGR